MIVGHDYDVLFQADRTAPVPDVAVVITCFNYAVEILEALESLRRQVGVTFDLVVVDDQSTDDSAAVVQDWLAAYQAEPVFRRVQLVRHQVNQGLPRSRNTGITLTETPYVFMLDADNVLYPRAIAALSQALRHSGCAMAYALTENFGHIPSLRNHEVWQPERFAQGNYIDAMSLITRAALEQVGGYRVMTMTGWEDYDLWCALVERGLAGCYVPEILCRYREHPQSMTAELVQRIEGRWDLLYADLQAAHPSLSFPGVAQGRG